MNTLRISKFVPRTRMQFQFSLGADGSSTSADLDSLISNLISSSFCEGETNANTQFEASNKTVTSIPEKDAIWNPNIQFLEDNSWFQRCSQLRVPPNVIPETSVSVEIARERAIRLLGQKFRHLCIEVGGLDEEKMDSVDNDVFEKYCFERHLQEDLEAAAENLVVLRGGDPVLPKGYDVDHDAPLLERLCSLGIDDDNASTICVELGKASARAVHSLSRLRGASTTVHFSLLGDDEGRVHLRCGKSLVKLNRKHYEKLLMMWQNQRKRDRLPCSSKHMADFHQDAFTMSLRYMSMQGTGFQAACPEDVFDVLLKYLDVRMECFASPLNSRYQRMCSAHLDTDKAFGSCGSFWAFRPTHGSYQANPPFVDAVIKKMLEHMQSLLERASIENGALSFVVIVPAWTQTIGWKSILNSTFLKRHLLLPQSEHGYCDGAQHRRPSRYRISTCDTSVFFLQNQRGSLQYRVTESVCNEIRRAFKSKHSQDIRQAFDARSTKRRLVVPQTRSGPHQRWKAARRK